jgi:hypothetical protein
MKTFTRTAIACLLCAISAIAFSQTTAGSGGEADALVKIKAKGLDKAFLLPGADFSGYKKVIIAPSEVAFQKNWLRDMNNNSMSPSRRLGDKDAQKIIAAARSGFDEIWIEAFKAAGYEVVTEPGNDVLKLVPSVFDLYINAPDNMAIGRSQSYTVEAGEAALSLDIRDSINGTLLGRAIDKRTAGSDMGRLQWTTSVSNRSDFGILFKSWANRAVKSLGELAKASPLPETLQPNKKVPKKE